MPRQDRLQQPPAILPDRVHLPLLRSMANAFMRILPDDLTFTLITQDKAGEVIAYVTNSLKPLAVPNTKKRRRMRRR